MKKELKKVTLYLSAEEHAEVTALAEDEGVTLSAVLRAQLGLKYKRRGAPKGNLNRRTRVTKREHGVMEQSDRSIAQTIMSESSNCRLTKNVIDVDHLLSL